MAQHGGELPAGLLGGNGIRGRTAFRQHHLQRDHRKIELVPGCAIQKVLDVRGQEAGIEQSGLDLQRARVTAGFQSILGLAAAAAFPGQGQHAIAQFRIIHAWCQYVGHTAGKGFLDRLAVHRVGQQDDRRMVQPGIPAHGGGNREGDIPFADRIQNNRIKGAFVQIVEGGIG